jgi:hypothetical protein
MVGGLVKRAWRFDPFAAAVLAAFTLLALLWGLLMPIHESADEQDHYRYMVFLKDHGRLPVQLPLPSESPGEGHQPPLYYALGALALKAAAPTAAFTEAPRQATYFDRQPVYFVHGPDEGLLRFQGQAWPPHLLRILQVLFLLAPAVALLGWMLSQALPRDHARLAWVLLALDPAFVALAGALNNDHGAFVFGTLALACLAPVLQGRPLGLRHWLGFGAAVGLAGLAKPTALGLLGVIPALAWALPGQRRKGGPWLALGLAGLILAPWFWRNAALYGDLSAWNALVADCPQCVHPKPWFNLHWWWFWLSRTFETFWGVFGWMTWRAGVGITVGFAGICLAALGGLAAGAWRRLRPEAWALVLGAFLGVLVVVLRHDMSLDPPAGRYFYGLLLPLGLGLGAGLPAPRWLPWLAGALLLGLHAWLILGRLLPMYHPHA